MPERVEQLGTGRIPGLAQHYLDKLRLGSPSHIYLACPQTFDESEKEAWKSKLRSMAKWNPYAAKFLGHIEEMDRRVEMYKEERLARTKSARERVWGPEGS